MAAAAVRFHGVHRSGVEDIVAIDVALGRRQTDWVDRLPPGDLANVVHALYYGHFLCHVFHRDYILQKGVNAIDFKARSLKRIDQQEAKYPAEHNVGHAYIGEEPLLNHYRRLDPCNSFNPGIGQTSKRPEFQ